MCCHIRKFIREFSHVEINKLASKKIIDHRQLLRKLLFINYIKNILREWITKRESQWKICERVKISTNTYQIASINFSTLLIFLFFAMWSLYEGIYVYVLLVKNIRSSSSSLGNLNFKKKWEKNFSLAYTNGYEGSRNKEK